MTNINTNFKSDVMKQWAPKPTSADITPFVFQTGEQFRYRCTPSECWDESPDLLRNIVDDAGNDATFSLNEEDAGECKVDDGWKVNIEELLFPGNARQPIIEKYIYIIRVADGAPYAEIYASVKPEAASKAPGSHELKDTQWQICYSLSKNSDISSRTFGDPVPPQIDLESDVYAFFLSPMQLSARALEYLCDNFSDCTVQENLQGAPGSLTVCPPDPFHWAECAHEDFLAPRIRDYRKFTTDEQIQSANTVRATLQGWIDHNDDEYGVENNLRTDEMETFAKEFDTYEKELREHMDRAAAYFAGWIDSKWHRVVEMTGQDDPLYGALTCGHWWFISRDLQHAEPTREAMSAMVLDEERFLYTHCLKELSAGQTPWWGNEISADDDADISSSGDGVVKWTKRSVSAIGGLVSNILPYYLHQRILDKTLKSHKDLTDLFSRTAVYARFAYAKDMKNLIAAIKSDPDQLSLWYKYKMTRETGAMRVPTKGSGNIPRVAVEISRHRKSIQLELKQLDDQIDTLKTSGKYWLRSKEVVKALRVPLDVILSSAVLGIETMALMHRLEMNQELSVANCSGFVKAGVDTARAITQIVEVYRKHVLTKAGMSAELITASMKGITRAAGALAIVSGLCEMYSRGSKMKTEVGREDWGAAVGQGVALLGAALSVAGGIIVVCTAGGGTLGPFGAGAGAIIGAVGAGLVLIGALFASWVARSEYEDFARGSCFGSVWVGSGRMAVSWYDKEIWYKDPPVNDIRALYALFSNFTVWVEGDGNPEIGSSGKLVIQTGSLSPHDRIWVHLVQSWRLSSVERDQFPPYTVKSMSSYGDRTCLAQIEWNPNAENDAFIEYTHDKLVSSSSHPDTFELANRVKIKPATDSQPPRIEIPLQATKFRLWSVNKYIDLGATDYSAKALSSKVLVELRRTELDADANPRSRPSGPDPLPRLPIPSDKFVLVETTDLAGGATKVSSSNSYHHGKLD
ncbi:MAG: hypothetical protein ACF8SC_03295 [Phycisphaerales bacterium JB037]